MVARRVGADPEVLGDLEVRAARSQPATVSMTCSTGSIGLVRQQALEPAVHVHDPSSNQRQINGLWHILGEETLTQ
jgi:hypothetical protein